MFNKLSFTTAVIALVLPLTSAPALAESQVTASERADCHYEGGVYDARSGVCKVPNYENTGSRSDGCGFLCKVVFGVTIATILAANSD